MSYVIYDIMGKHRRYAPVSYEDDQVVVMDTHTGQVRSVNYEVKETASPKTINPISAKIQTQQAALVIAGNEYLAERARQADARSVEILPSVVDVSLYQTPEEITGSPFRIGWVGSPVTAPYLDLVREPLMTLSRELDLQLVLIGPGKVSPFGEIPTTVLPWSEERETSISRMFDVGVMPLVDGPFERGKCGYKLVQYMAGGLPVVASPVSGSTARSFPRAGTDSWPPPPRNGWMRCEN